MKILILGIGAIGSNLTARLVADLKNGHQITVLDKDTVEERNVQAGTQFYIPDQIGLSKVEALQFNIYKNYQKEIDIIHQEFKGTIKDWDKYDLTVDCFDNNEARKNIQFYYEIGKDLKRNDNVLHVGFSDQFTFAIEWAENYQVPSDITTGFDICETQGASSFVNYVTSIGSMVIQEFILSNKKIEIIGNKMSHQLIQ